MDPDALYDLPPDEFTAARDALAKQLKADGEKEAAAAVKALRRPSLAAWAINRAARERQKDMRDLLSAAAGLRRAHERLLAGKGDRAVLQEAAEHERQMVSAMARAAAEVAQAHGRSLSGTVLDRVRETLHAAATDDEVRAALEAGRLERESEAIGAAFGFEGAPAPARRKPPPRRNREAERAQERTRRDEQRATREQERAAREEERVAREALRAEAKEADGEVRAAEKRLAAAEAEIEDARAALRTAKEAAAAAHARLSD